MAHVLERGRYDAPGEEVSAGVPKALPPLPAGVPNNRLGLAAWLVSPEHPLTARVTANRFWAEVFGVGLVATVNDFGKAGEPPSHPPLLDWLAVEFRESGWDVKHLFRLMVTSSSYRQSAATTAEKLATDPDNRLLSRGPRFRMDGEMIRDLALAASGLLLRTVGGPSVKPYQPAGLWEEVGLPGTDSHYEQDTDDGLYRRSLYTFWKRSAPALVDLYNQDLPESVRGNQRLTGMTSGQARLPIVPSLFQFSRAGASGAWVSELLPWTRQVVDDLAIVKSVYTEAINHDPGMLKVNTGSERPGKPSLGAWLSYGLGPLNPELPSYVVMTSRLSATDSTVQPLSLRLWGSAFLPERYAAVPIRGSGDPVLYLANPPGVDGEVRRATIDAIRAMNGLLANELGSPSTSERTEQYELAMRLQHSIPAVVDTASESASTLALYGDQVHEPGTFAANCLMARRMVEQGVRFVQVYHRGWDAHFGLPANHRRQCQDIDQACYGLMVDLKNRGLLEDTLVVWGGEFGRTVYCQGELTSDDYGRDHHPRCFSMWLAGAGIRPGIVYGETDDFGYNIVESPVHLRDLHATVLHLFGLDPNTLTFRHAGLAEKLVGVGDPVNIVSGILS